MSKEMNKKVAERQKDYGDAIPNLTRIGRGWGSILDIDDIPAHEVSLMMDFLKTIRCSINPEHQDSWDDKEGYTFIGRAAANDIK
jgi:hypothetical protein